MVFADIAQFLAYFSTRVAAVDHHIHQQVQHAATRIQQDARGRIGNYQGAEGPFQAWAPLSQNTLDGFDFGNGRHIPGKIELGYAPPDNPVLREGAVRDSIETTVQHHSAAVGSNSDVAKWQELGTKTQPPRSFLGAAAHHQADHTAHQIGATVFGVLSGRIP